MSNALRNALLLVYLFTMGACTRVNDDWRADAELPASLHASIQEITDVILHDIFSPPQAGRIYAYATVAGYEAARHDDPALLGLAGQLNGLDALPQPDPQLEYAFPLASAIATLTVGQALIFSEEKVEARRAEIEEEFREVGMPEAVYARSVDYGAEVAAAVLAWADQDNYKQSRTFPKFSITNDPARWRPTPPDYMDGIEPHWTKMRPFVLDSPAQFKPLAPPPYDLTEGSEFRRDVEEVYNALDQHREERVAIASFWDCNPFVSHHRGHVMFATKKITPGGHWMGITKSVCRKEGLSTARSAEAYVRVALALADGFISCWDEKYRSNLVRPETVINEFIDEDWAPVLQTPPFPEYTSGHSVISRAAAVALTDLFGDNYHYVDSVEVDWGLPARPFDSFLAASNEAAVSRLYGGIHYGPAIEEGVKQGQAVGEFVVDRLRTRVEPISRK